MKVKKIFAFGLAVALCVSLMCSSAAAATEEVVATARERTSPIEMDDVVGVAAPTTEERPNFAIDGVIVTATDRTSPIDMDNIVGAVEGVKTSPISRANVDLGEGKRSIDWDVNAQSYLNSADYFKTNTQKITIHLKGDVKVSLTVSLYSKAGTLIGTATKDVGTFVGTDYSFSGLTSSEYYYFRIANNGTQDVNVTGSISD